MKRITLLAAAIALSACSPADILLVGPCSASKRAGPDEAYKDLALVMTIHRVGKSGDTHDIINDNVKLKKMADLREIREAWIPTIEDECLRAHASDWLAFYEDSVSRVVPSKDDSRLSDYEREQAEKEDRRHALADKLGVRP